MMDPVEASWKKRASRMALGAYYAISGRGGGWLEHKNEFHRRRFEMERAFLEEAKSHPEYMRARACPACGGEDASDRFESPVGFSFAVCARDGTVYMNPAPSEAMLARLYNDPAHSFNHLGAALGENTDVKPKNQDDLAAILRLAPPELRGGKLLDVGCSKGAFLLAAREDFEVHGVELNDTTAAVARAIGLDVKTGRLADLPGREEFAVITLLQVIEHIVEVKDFLDEARRVLLPDGVIYLNTPAIDSTSFRYLRERHTHVQSFAHVSLFSRRSLAALAERCGYEMIAHEHCGGMDLSLADITTLALAKEKFRHRMAWYQPRVYYALDVIEQTPVGKLKTLIVPPGNESYQRAILRKRRPS